jgi:hypothetical protein
MVWKVVWTDRLDLLGLRLVSPDNAQLESLLPDAPALQFPDQGPGIARDADALRLMSG